MEGDDKEQRGAELFMHAMGQPALLCDAGLICTACNDAMCRSLGLSRDQIVGHGIESMLEPEVGAIRRAFAQEVLDSGESQSFEDTRGSRTFAIYMSATRNSEGQVNGVATFAVDVSLKKAAMQSAIDAEANYRRIIETCAEGVWQIDTEQKTCFVNQQMASMLGYSVEEFMGKSMYDFMDSSEIQKAEENVKRRQQGIGENHYFRLQHKSGKDVWTAMSSNALTNGDGVYSGALALVTDITEQRQLEQRLLQAKKLESLSVLAGGIAHDFNNVLAVICGNLELIKQNADPDKTTDGLVARIVGATERATLLTSQMLAFSGRARFVAEQVDINSIVEEITTSFRGALSTGSNLQLDKSSEPIVIDADPLQVRQMMLSLLKNAGDAIGSASAGTISVKTATRTLTKENLARSIVDHDLEPGTYASIQIRDDGHGMDPETIGRLFEPFFSTRFTGRGLGMAVVLGILRSHRAGIFVESTPGKGTCFEIVFPLASDALQATASSDEFSIEAVAARGLVVVVDDDAMVLEAIAALLEAHGLRVLPCQSGRDALDAIDAKSEPIAFVLLDMTMPGMSGAAVHEELRERYPSLPVVLTSGYSPNDLTRFVQDGRTAFLKKPYGVTELYASLAKLSF